MNTTSTDGVVLKQDVLGWGEDAKTLREKLLDEFERSGLPGQKFAELAGVKYLTFAPWVQLLRRQRGDHPVGKITGSKPPVHWLDAVMEPSPDLVVQTGGLTLVLHLSGGVRVELNDVKQVELAAALVRALQKPC